MIVVKEVRTTNQVFVLIVIQTVIHVHLKILAHLVLTTNTFINQYVMIHVLQELEIILKIYV